MPRWSEPIRLAHHAGYQDYLGYPGCYEIGYLRGGVFTAYYVGKSSNLSRRMSAYMDPARCHNGHIARKLYAARHNLYVRVMRTQNHHGMEARLQSRWGVGRTGAYAWNKRIEWSHINS